jgi:pyruvate formate lyase activating enzyme
MIKEALFYEQMDRGQVRCSLCPHLCLIQDQHLGKCHVRKNNEGKLLAENYGLTSALHLDPIEKKPFYHFHPGAHILSVGSVGCNLKCNFCQNCEISQTTVENYLKGQYYEPTDIVQIAQKQNENLGLAFTYNEPIIYYEFMLDIAKESKKAGLLNVMVSNGFINQEPLQELLPYMDALNIDLKSFNNRFYKNVGAWLSPILDTLKTVKESDKHLEITYLLIPSANDDLSEFIEMLIWVREELGRDTVLHLSRYFPAYKSNIQKTSLGLMFNFCEKARQYLDYVYLGNVTGSESQNTICNSCGHLVVSRNGYFIQKNGIDNNGNCNHCKNHIIEF